MASPVASRGPVPKRKSERLGHMSKAEREGVSVVRIPGKVAPPPLPKGLHPVADRWYRALRRSAQAEFYEPSDWALAVFVAHQMDQALRLNILTWSPHAVKVIMDASDHLLVTEAARRRARIEVERGVTGTGTSDGATPKEPRDHRSRLHVVRTAQGPSAPPTGTDGADGGATA